MVDVIRTGEVAVVVTEEAARRRGRDRADCEIGECRGRRHRAVGDVCVDSASVVGVKGDVDPVVGDVDRRHPLVRRAGVLVDAHRGRPGREVGRSADEIDISIGAAPGVVGVDDEHAAACRVDVDRGVRP